MLSLNILAAAGCLALVFICDGIEGGENSTEKVEGRHLCGKVSK